MRRSRILFISFIFSTFLFFLNGEISYSEANPLWVYQAEFGGLIPKEDNSCSMPNASVLLEIFNPNPNNPFEEEFTGNYTLYNPNNFALNLTIAAPFSSYLFGLSSNCTIKINGTVIPYDIIEFQYNETETYIWEDYFIYEKNLIVCNITIPMNKTIILEYKFETLIFSEPPRVKIDYLDFDYDIATAAAWNGTISEIVEFKVHGRQPDSYSDYNNLLIIDISDGKRYIWEWINIVITPGTHPIKISYKIDYTYISLGNYYIAFLLLGMISLILLLRRGKQIKLKVYNM